MDRHRPDYFDSLFAQHQATTGSTRLGNLDVVTFDDQRQLGFCHLVNLAPITFFRGQDRTQMQWPIIESIAAVYLAIQHLNTGNGRVVSEVDGLDQRCNVRFSAEVVDTELSEQRAVRELLNITSRNTSIGERVPCAFLGAIRSAVSIPTSVITGIKGYPQFSAGSTSPALNDKSTYKLFGRTVPGDDATAVSAILFLRDRLQVTHLAILHTDESYGNEYAKAMIENAKRLAPDMVIIPASVPAIDATQQDLEPAISIVRTTQFKYVYAIMHNSYFNNVMEVAYRQDVAGPGYTWIFADSTSPATITSQQFAPGSPLAIASQGVSVLQAEGGVPGMAGYDRFMKAFLELKGDQNNIAYINNKIPRYEDDPNYVHQGIENFILPSVPSYPVTFYYDATIALGLAACNVSSVTTTTTGDGIENTSASMVGILTGERHFSTTINALPFEGASGNVIFDPSTGSRDPSSTIFELTTVVQNDELDPETGMVRFRSYTTERFKDGEWNSISPREFSDGTTNIPPDLPPLSTDYRYIGNGVRSAGLVLALVTMGMAIGLSTWTYLKRHGKVVKVSQPIFLHVICFGNFLMASAIIPLSFDDEIVSTRGCSIACRTTYWLFFIGFAVAFSALFSKTWRINKLFYNESYTRITVSAFEVTKPMAVLLTSNIIVLTVWTVVSPLEWERSTEQVDIFGRVTQSQGYCDGNNKLLFYAILGFVNATCLAIALYQVYRARHISNEFGETKYIIASISGMLLVSLIGLPSIVIASDNPRAHFFVLSCIIFFICVLFLLFIFVPKIHFHWEIIHGKKSMRNVVKDFLVMSNVASKGSNHHSHDGEGEGENSQSRPVTQPSNEETRKVVRFKGLEDTSSRVKGLTTSTTPT